MNFISNYIKLALKNNDLRKFNIKKLKFKTIHKFR